MRIGISVITHAGQSLWSNGIGQNIFHLATLCAALPFVQEVLLLNCGDQGEFVPDAGSISQRFELACLRDADRRCDVIIEMGGAIDPVWLRRQRAFGARVVFMSCGQPYSALVEPTIFGKPTFFGEPERCDEVWILPKDARFAPMLRTIHRCPVVVVPYIWSARFVEDLFPSSGVGDASVGYPRNSLTVEKAKAAIFEPNIATIKCGIVPLMIAESVNRFCSEMISRVDLVNGSHLINHPTFSILARNLQIHLDGKLSIYPREYFARFVSSRSNVVISHQIDCDQNYLYLDCLYGGYPLIHNSDWLRDYGYYYPLSDIGAGSSALQDALKRHDVELPDYRMRNSVLFRSLDPLAPINKDFYARRLLSL